MRAITKESINALYNRENFRKGNTKVKFMKDKWYLLLHDNIIAVLQNDNTLMITNAGWKSNTTKERLNGLDNVQIVQKKGVWYLNGVEWNGELTEVK